MDTNGHYLAAILEVFSDSADSARFLSLVCRQILTAGLFDFYRQFVGIECKQVLSDF